MGEAIYLVNNFKVEKVIFNYGPYNDLEKELIKVLDKNKIKYFLNQEIEKHGELLGKFYRLKNIIKRRKNIFKIYNEIENIIDDLETYKNN